MAGPSLTPINRLWPVATPTHEVIAYEHQTPPPPAWRPASFMERFSRGATNMRPLSSGNTYCRIHPGFPTLDPVFFAAHKGRAPFALRWYIHQESGRYGLRIQHRPLVWWLVRHKDPAGMGVLRLLLRFTGSEINWGTWVWRRRDGPHGMLSHIDFTALDLALIRQPDEVVEALREEGAKTSLEVFPPSRLKKFYRPGFPEKYGRYNMQVRKETMRKRRSSFGFAVEALSSAEVNDFRLHCSKYLDPDVERHIFWDGKPYGSLPRRHAHFSRTSSEMRVPYAFWWEEQNMHLTYRPSKHELSDSLRDEENEMEELETPESLVHIPSIPTDYS